MFPEAIKNILIDYIKNLINYIFLKKNSDFGMNTLLDWNDNIIDYFFEIIDYIDYLIDHFFKISDYIDYLIVIIFFSINNHLVFALLWNEISERKRED